MTPPSVSGSKAARSRSLLESPELLPHGGPRRAVGEDRGASGLPRDLGVGAHRLGREMLSRLIAAGHEIGVAYVLGGWLDVDDAFDLARARNFT